MNEYSKFKRVAMKMKLQEERFDRALTMIERIIVWFLLVAFTPFLCWHLWKFFHA